MLWLDYLKQSGDAYADLKRFLEEQKARTLGDFQTAKDMEAVNKLKGDIECLVKLQILITQEERAERERSIRAAQATRTHA